MTPWRHAVVVLLYRLNSGEKLISPIRLIVYVNALGAMAAGFIRGVDNYLFHKLTQKRRGQFGGFGVFLYDFQKILDIDNLGFRLGYGTSQFLCGLFQIRLFLFKSLESQGFPRIRTTTQ